MTNPTPARSISAELRSPRTLAAWGLLGFTALYLFFAFFDWVLPGGSFASRSAGADFTDLPVMAMPILAVLLAIHVEPVLKGARLIAMIALIEYAVAIFFGVITFLIGFGAVFDGYYSSNDGYNAFKYLIMGLATLVLFLIAAYATFRSFLSVGGKLSLGGVGSAAPAYQTGTPAAANYQTGTATPAPVDPSPYQGGQAYEPEPPTQTYQNPNA